MFSTCLSRLSSATPFVLVLALALAGCLASPVQAGQFSVSPVRIFIAPKDRTTAVTVTNESDVELVMQADIYQWQQTATGAEDLTLTEDVIVAPPIVKLAPGAKQTIRLAMLKPVSAGQQLTYRLIVREIPEVRPPEPGIQLRIALAFSLPIFISQPGVKNQLVCELKRSAPDAVRAECENRGTAYAQATEFKLLNAAGAVLASNNTATYVLPGIKRSVEVKRAAGPIAGGKIQLVVTQDDQTVQTFDAVIAD